MTQWGEVQGPPGARYQVGVDITVEGTKVQTDYWYRPVPESSVPESQSDVVK